MSIKDDITKDLDKRFWEQIDYERLLYETRQKLRKSDNEQNVADVGESRPE